MAEIGENRQRIEDRSRWAPALGCSFVIVVGLALCSPVLWPVESWSQGETVPASPDKPLAAPPTSARLSVRRDRPKSELPFFKKNPAVEKKIREERAVVVSVRREDLNDDLMRFTMLGAGHVSRPKDFCFRLGQQYHRLLQISDHFKTVNFDPISNQVFIITEALGYQARMILQLTPVSEDWRSEIQWKVIWGHFKGMTGVIGFEKVANDKTEVSVNARYEAKELPVPKILMGFALEVITQKVAEKMRSYLESQPLSAADEPLPPSSKAPFFPMAMKSAPPAGAVQPTGTPEAKDASKPSGRSSPKTSQKPSQATSTQPNTR